MNLSEYTIRPNPNDYYIRCQEYEQAPETGMVRRCILEMGHTVRHTHMINYAKPQNVSREWAESFLDNWNEAVRLWDEGYLFDKQDGFYWNDQITGQQKYADICCAHLIPNGFAEPHVVAQGG